MTSNNQQNLRTKLEDALTYAKALHNDLNVSEERKIEDYKKIQKHFGLDYVPNAH